MHDFWEEEVDLLSVSLNKTKKPNMKWNLKIGKRFLGQK